MPDPAATFYVQLTEGVNYVRAELPARYLPGKIVTNPAVTTHTDPPDIEVESQEGQAAIWMFPGNAMRAVLIASQSRKGVRVLSESDDNYFRSPILDFGHWKQRSPAGDWHQHSYDQHRAIVAQMDGAIVSTPELEKLYREVNPNVFVCRNCVDPDDWPDKPDHQKDGVLRVGWAASDSHAVDGPLVEQALKWASRQDGVEVVIVGIKTWEPQCRFRYVPFKPLREYRASLHEHIDVMLCPLAPDPWTVCKSDVKALEAAMSGAVPVVSGTAPYRPWKDQPALVCYDDGDFTQAVKRLVRNRDETADMAAKAREYVVKERSIQGNVWRWQEACETVPVPA